MCITLICPDCYLMWLNNIAEVTSQEYKEDDFYHQLLKRKRNNFPQINIFFESSNVFDLTKISHLANYQKKKEKIKKFSSCCKKFTILIINNILLTLWIPVITIIVYLLETFNHSKSCPVSNNDILITKSLACHKYVKSI